MGMENMGGDSPHHILQLMSPGPIIDTYAFRILSMLS